MTMPSMIIGLVLLGTCLVSVWSISRLQRNLAYILSDTVTDLEAVQDLEIQVRQLRILSFMNAIDPKPERQDAVLKAQRHFETILGQVRRRTSDEQQRRLVDEIQAGYRRYQSELAEQLSSGTVQPADFARWADAHPIRHLDAPCQELLRLNKETMARTAHDSELLSEQARFAMLLVGILGPASGLIIGYGLARGLSRSIARLSVRLQDVHAHLEQEVDTVRLEAGGDLPALDRQLDRVVVRVREVAETLQRQQQEMLRAEQLAAVGQLAANVAHEIRNPLTAIKMLVGAARRPSHAKPLSAVDLQVIYDEIGQLEHTVQTLLDYARPPQLVRQPTDLRKVVQQALDLLRGRAQQQHVLVETRLPEAPVVAAVDANQMRGVLLNLLLNALDALPQGGRVEIELCGGPEVRLRVVDDGPGIAPAVAERLFTPFATTKPTGNGLGLSICHRVLEQHGGSISARNRPSGGAEFTLTLPSSPQEAADGVARSRG